MLSGTPAEGLALPARFYEMKDSGSYTIHIKHDDAEILIQTSAGLPKKPK